MRDYFCWEESAEDAAEENYSKMLQSDGRLKCHCGNIFDSDKEGGTLSPNPYAMPVCGECFDAACRDKGIA